MAGNIWGEGPRGGIFGARVDPALLRELEKRAADKRNEIERSTLGGRAKQWWDKSTFFKPAYEALVGAATLPGDVMSGAQPTMVADPQTGEFHTVPELMDRAGALAGSMTLGAGAIPAETNALRMGIKAYHGSPHSFDRFDASKIGTGEGAQAYGHGLYFAENESVAKDYRNKLGGAERVEVDGKPIWNRGETTLGRVDLPREQQLALDAITRFVDPGEAARFLQGRSPIHEGQGFHEAREKAIELLRGGRMTVPARGKMYEVDIAAEPEQFLDFDAPISAQPQHAQDLLQSMHRYTVKQDGKTWRVLHPGGWVPGAAKDFYRSEEAALKAAEQLNQGRSVQDLVPRNPEQVAPFREAGIPGIRYLDQGSRAAGEGSRNYVIFPGNEKLISILKKYGLPISAAGVAALHELHPEEAQAAQGRK